MIGSALVAVRDWTLLLGPGLMPALNALLLGTLMSGPGWCPHHSDGGTDRGPAAPGRHQRDLFGHVDPVAPMAALAALPVAAWELSLGIYMIVKGFKPSPIDASITPATAAHL